MTAIEQLAAGAKEASRRISSLSTDVKNAVLRSLAGRIESSVAAIKAANEADLAAARAAGIGEAKLKRLALSDKAIAQMAEGLRQVADLPDPVGQATRDVILPTGLRVRKVRAPLGVILMIYEARPNVTVDAFALCFKSGNACILKGGREAAQSNAALAGLAAEALREQGVPDGALTLFTSSDREAMKELLRLDKYIDLAIPRGGEELIRFVHEHARVPTVQHFHGVCHIFVDESANQPRAIEVCATAKTSAPATCNAAECILVHEKIAPTFVPQLVERYRKDGVEVRGDETVRRLAPAAVAASQSDWGKEFLDLIIAMRVVHDLDGAIAHINRYTSNHTEAILTADESNAGRFVDEVQSSCTLINASTRFNDGFSLGLGAEIGISTSKIHAYGPMGLEELTTQRYVVEGAYQTR